MKNYIIIILAILYPICILVWGFAVFMFTGIFLILLTLVASETWNKKRVFLLLSPIITYPLYIGLYFWGVIFFEFFPPFYVLSLYLLLYVVIYGLLLRDIGTWIESKVRKIFIVSLVFLSIITFAYASVASQCREINSTVGFGDGPTQEEEKMCSFFHLYHPYSCHDYELLCEGVINVYSQGPIFMSCIFVINLLFFYPKGRK